MSRDFAKRQKPSATKSRPRSHTPAWIWLFSGMIMGAFAMFLAQLAGLTPTAQTPAAATNTVAGTTAQPAKDIPKPRFDFYKLLKENEVAVPGQMPVLVPESVPVPPAEAEPQATDGAPITDGIATTGITTTGTATTTAPATEQLEYILQVGSFKSVVDADRLRAELTLLNLSAHVEEVAVRNGEIWHRVLVGPFRSSASLEEARSALIGNNINPLLLKRKPGQ